MNIYSGVRKHGDSRRIFVFVCVAVVLVLTGTFRLYETDGALADKGAGSSTATLIALGQTATGPAGQSLRKPSAETAAAQPVDMKGMEEAIKDIQVTGEKAESRTYDVKMVGRELLDLVKIAVAILLFMAVGLPLAIWLLARRGLLGFSNQSAGVAAALLEVEERQAKLVNIFKELQDEVEILHASTGPDLRNLVEQAQQYLDLNDRDLRKIDLPQAGSGRGSILKQ